MENMMPKTIREVVLTRIRFNKRYSISQQRLITLGNDVMVEVNKVADELLIELGKEVYGKKGITGVKKIVKSPKNWFEHLKCDLGMRYKEKEIDVFIPVDVYALFPELTGTNPTVVIKPR